MNTLTPPRLKAKLPDATSSLSTAMRRLQLASLGDYNTLRPCWPPDPCPKRHPSAFGTNGERSVGRCCRRRQLLLSSSAATAAAAAC